MEETIDLNQISPQVLRNNAKSYEEKFIPSDDNEIDLSTKSFSEISKSKFDSTASFFNPVGNTGIGKSQYDEGISLEQLNLKPLEQIRASKQGWADQLGNALAGGVGSGLVGALEGFTNLGDQLMNVGNTTEEWERGTLSTILNDLKTDINELTPMYRKDRADTFDWNDSGFYFEVLKGAVDSAVAFGLPGAGYGMAVSKLGSLLGKAALGGKRLDVLTRAGGRAVGMSNPAQKLGAGTAALLSNYNEGTVMGMQVYDEKKQEFIDTLTQDLVNKRMQAGEDTSISEQEFKDIELEASMEAGKAAETVRDFNHFMIASNYISVKSLFSGAKSTAARSMVKAPTLKNWAKDQLIGAPMEGLEEIGQGILQKEVGYRAQDNIYTRNNVDTSQISGLEDYRKLDGMEFGDRLLDFATRDETLLEGMMGLIGGPIQYAVTGLPGAAKAKEAQQLRYNKQQGIVGRNAEFIKDKLTYEQSAQDLIGSFDDYRKNILGKDEYTEEDSKAYEALIEDTTFDTLVVENFFGGTTENLEKQLQDIGKDENATPEEKAAADKHLGRLAELEQRFNQYSMYQDGAHMFATKVRTERLENIKKVLDTAYPQMESELTGILNAKLEANAKRNKEKKLNKLEEVLYYVDEVETIDEKGKKKIEKTRVPVRSVTQAIDAHIEGKELKSSYGSIHNEFKDGKAFDIAAKNRMMKLKIDRQVDFYKRIMDESKSSAYENEFAIYQDASKIQDSKQKLTALKEVKASLDKKYPPAKYLNLKTRVQNEVSFLEKAIIDAEQLQAQTVSQQASTQTQAAQAKKVETKTTGKKSPVVQTTDPTTGESIVTTQPDLDNWPQLDVEPNEGNPIMAAAEAKAKALKEAEAAKSKTGTTPDSNVNTPVDEKAVRTALSAKMKKSKEDYIKAGKTPEQAEALVLAGLPAKEKALYNKMKADAENKAATKAEPLTGVEAIRKKLKDRTEYHISQGVNKPLAEVMAKGELTLDEKDQLNKEALRDKKGSKLPVVVEQTNPAHLLSEEEAQVSIENFEVKPTGKNDNALAQTAVVKAAQANTALVEGVKKKDENGDLVDDGTRAKLMTTGATVEFESKVLKSFRDKTGVEVEVSVSTKLPQGMYGKGEALARRAIEIFNGAKKKYDETKKWSQSEIDFMVKYLPIGVDFGGGAISYVYPMNWENDSVENPGKKNKYTDKQNKGEKDLRTKVISAALKGGKVKVKVKGQTPGALNFGGEEKMLSEMDGFLDKPMAVKMFISIDGGLVPAVKGDSYNPFFGTKMTYNTATGPEAWTGIYVIEVKAMNGMSFPLKVNTKNHNSESASIIYDLFNKMITGKKGNNLMNVPVIDNDQALYDKITAMLPGLTAMYGKGFTYAEVINDMVYEGAKTRGRASELLFEKGKVIFGGNSLNATDFGKAENKAKFIQFIQDFKAFNVNVSKLNDPKYRQHVFSSYLSTNADIDNMFTADGTLNPSGDSGQRMKSGAMYLDVTSAQLVQPEKKAEEVKPQPPAPVKKETKVPSKTKQTETDKKKALMMNADTIADALADATSGNVVIEKETENLKDQEIPKSKIEKIVEAEKEAEKTAEEKDQCKINAAAKAAAKKKFGGIDL